MRNRATLGITAALAVVGAGFAALVAARSPRIPDPTIASSEPAVGGVYGIGLVEPLDESTRVAPAVAGVVAAVQVVVGQRVAAGDVLVVLDDAEARARVQAAESIASAAAIIVDLRRAELAIAQARLARVSGQPRPEDVAPATEAERVARAEAAEARERLARYQKLARGIVPAADLAERTRQAEAADARAAQAAAEALRAAAPGWTRDVAVAEAEAQAAVSAIAVAEATAAADRSAVEIARVALSQRTIHAPRAGKIMRLAVHAGEWVAPEGGGLLDLADDSRLRLTAEVDALDAWRAGTADAIAWRRGDPTRTWTAKVLLIEPVARAKRESSGAPGDVIDTRVRCLRFSLVDSGDLLPGEQLELRIPSAPHAETGAALSANP